jgi:hypothetical protein
MKIMSKAFLFLLIPICIDLIIAIVLAFAGTGLQFAGFAFGSGILIVFSLIWIPSINRIRMTNVVTFLKRFVYIFAGKFIFLIIMLFISLKILESDRFFFVLGFVITTLFIMPIEIWFCMQKKGIADA